MLPWAESLEAICLVRSDFCAFCAFLRLSPSVRHGLVV